MAVVHIAVVASASALTLGILGVLFHQHRPQINKFVSVWIDARIQRTLAQSAAAEARAAAHRAAATVQLPAAELLELRRDEEKSMSTFRQQVAAQEVKRRLHARAAVVNAFYKLVATLINGLRIAVIVAGISVGGYLIHLGVGYLINR